MQDHSKKKNNHVAELRCSDDDEKNCLDSTSLKQQINTAAFKYDRDIENSQVRILATSSNTTPTVYDDEDCQSTSTIINATTTTTKMTTTTTNALLGTGTNNRPSKEESKHLLKEVESTRSTVNTTTDNNNVIQLLPKEARNLLAGGIAGMIAKSFVAPFERIKILFQISSTKFCWHDVPVLAKNIVRTEGFRALWKGHTATIIRVFPYAGIQFMVFDSIKSYFLTDHQNYQPQQQQQQQQHKHDNKHYPLLAQSNDDTNPILQSRDTKLHFDEQEEQEEYQQQIHSQLQPPQTLEQEKVIAGKQFVVGASGSSTSKKNGEFTALQSLVAGMMAGATSVFFTYPLDLTRAQLATQGANSNKGFVTVLTDNFTNRGFFGFFRGLTPTLLGILPYAGIAFSLNEQGKQKIRTVYNRDLTTIERMQCGAGAGLIAQTAAYPFEVTRRRMQTLGIVANTTNAFAGGVATNNSAPAPIPMNMTLTIQTLYKEQGIRGFFKGVSMNWLKGPLAFSISFTTFDAVKGWMEIQSKGVSSTHGDTNATKTKVSSPLIKQQERHSSQ